MQAELIDSYVHKTVERHRRGSHLKFLTSQSLFSSNVIDAGTNLLLRVIEANAGRKFDQCLDLGCGYGALGLPLVASGVAESVEMVDRDALAVDFASKNAQDNGQANLTAHGSLGLDDASSDSYDLIVANLPGKAGSEVLEHLLLESARRIGSDGQFWAVVVTPLWAEIEVFISELPLELQVEMIHVEQTPRHTAFGFRGSAAENRGTPTDSGLDVYRRGEIDFTVGGRKYSVQTSRGVEEFDSLNYSTRLILEQLNEIRREHWEQVVVFNVTQGFVPIALKAAGMADKIVLADRDLLALRTALRNLQINGLDDPANELWHGSAWLPESPESPDKFGLVVGSMRGDEPRRAIEIGLNSVIERLAVGGTAVIAGSSTAITRMLKTMDRKSGVHLLDRNRLRGSSAVTLRKSR